MQYYTLKNAGIKTTISLLFGNPALGKYWTEHMLGYFDPACWVLYINPFARLFFIVFFFL